MAHKDQMVMLTNKGTGIMRISADAKKSSSFGIDRIREASYLSAFTWSHQYFWYTN